MDRARALSGLDQPGDLTRLLEVTARALAACLAQPDRQRWAATFPRTLRELFLRIPYDGAQRAANVYAAVTRAQGVAAGFGIEHAQAAIRALASDLPTDVASLLARRLPVELGELLTALPHSAAAEVVHQASASRASGALSSAAVGSTHPVSEGQPKTAQTGSVSAWDKSRMDRSLGSGRGPAADADTLASGRPGSRRGLSGSDDDGER